MLIGGLLFSYIFTRWFFTEEPKEASLFETPSFTSQKESPKTYIYVDIKGAVMVPGVYRMESDDRIFEAIERAGGFHPDANLSSLNQAGFLNDGMRIDVLFMDETLNVNPRSPQASSLVSLNQATQSELESLSGIGPQTALSIIAYREETPFKTIEDLLNVSGIGEVTYQTIKDQIVP